MASTLRGSSVPLCDAFDVALLDLDGVVYIGGDAVPNAPKALAEARQAGMRLAFVTNNAARPPQAVAEHLSELGIDAEAKEVITSSQAAARYLVERLPSGARVLVLGTTGLEVALREQGLTPVSQDDENVAAVVQGYSPQMNWRLLAEGSVAIRRGVPWVATNVDPTVPSPRGPLPGNGSLVAALRHATGVQPVVTGKPDPTMHRETLIRTAAKRPVVVGDRLDTDIEGANAVGCPSLLVFTGVTEAGELIGAPEKLRPTFIGADLRDLLVPHTEPQLTARTASCGQWQATVGGGTDRGGGTGTGSGTGGSGGDGDGDGDDRDAIELRRVPGASTSPADPVDAVRALCAAAWAAHPHADAPASMVVRAGDDAADEVVRHFGL